MTDQTELTAAADAAVAAATPRERDRIQSTPKGLRYLCATHDEYRLAPRRYARFDAGTWTWSSDPAGPFIDDHRTCSRPNNWSDER